MPLAAEPNSIEDDGKFIRGVSEKYAQDQHHKRGDLYTNIAKRLTFQVLAQCGKCLCPLRSFLFQQLAKLAFASIDLERYSTERGLYFLQCSLQMRDAFLQRAGSDNTCPNRCH
ncbi:hypothetical protein WN73_37030 [Bradyrhizobium sp. CCBAU 45394]|nr:hypothetical protein [Bradyrhizobium sp. CCBAU 45394]